MNSSWFNAYIAIIFATALVACGEDHHRHPRNSDDLTKVQNEEPSANEAVGGFRGYIETNNVLNERLFKHPDAFELSAYFEAASESKKTIASVFGGSMLRDLLGSYRGDGQHVEMKNALPNAINMLLWYMVADGLAADLSAPCGHNSSAKAVFRAEDVAPRFVKSLSTLCTHITDRSATDQDYESLWNIIVDVDAPDSERASWIELARSERFTEISAREQVRELITAAIYNPYFLLKQ